jgi:hypothetical protein
VREPSQPLKARTFEHKLGEEVFEDDLDTEDSSRGLVTTVSPLRSSSIRDWRGASMAAPA